MIAIKKLFVHLGQFCVPIKSFDCYRSGKQRNLMLFAQLNYRMQWLIAHYQRKLVLYFCKTLDYSNYCNLWKNPFLCNIWALYNCPKFPVIRPQPCIRSIYDPIQVHSYRLKGYGFIKSPLATFAAFRLKKKGFVGSRKAL